MILMGNSVKVVLAYGIVAIVILLVSYLVIVKPILNETNEATDRAFEQSEQIQRNVGESIERSLDQAEKAQRQARKQAAATN
jgi:type II secretory pathway component PulM